MIEKTKKLNVTQKKESIISRLMIVGDPQSGKTAFVNKLITGKFTTSYVPTLGVDYTDKHFELNGNLFYLNILDFSGKEEYLEIRNQFYKDATVLLIFLDLTSKKSVDLSVTWLSEARQNGANCPIIVVGSKSDIKKTSLDTDRLSSMKQITKTMQLSSKQGNSANALLNEVANLCR